MVDDKIKQYIENNIFPSYEKNDNGHNLDHIMYVIKRSLKFANTLDDINYNMVYVIAAYHDIGHYIDRKNHEKVSSLMLLNDDNLKKFFSEEEIVIMSEAVYDHRASMDSEPRSIYGKIVSSADRNVDVDEILKRVCDYNIKHFPNLTEEQILENVKKHIIEKFGKNGYAVKKMYFEDLDYDTFLCDISKLVKNEEKFDNKIKKYINATISSKKISNCK